MTKKEAKIILMESALRDIRGTGLGYRSTTEKHRERVRQAIKIIHKDVYGHEIDEFNIS